MAEKIPDDHDIEKDGIVYDQTAKMPANISDSKMYLVEISTSFEFLGATLRPDQRIEMRGDLVKEHQGSIRSAKAI